MNKVKKLITIGVILLLCVVAMIAIASAGGVVPIQQTTGDGSGTLNIGVLCHHNLISKEMTIQRVDVPLPKPMYGDEDMIAPAPGTLLFVNGNTLPKDQFDKFPKVGEPRAIELLGDGTFNGRYPPIVLGVTLLDGNGGQPEYAIVSIYEGGSSYIHFIGHAVSMSIEPEPTPYCYWVNETTEIYHPEVNHTVYIGEVNHSVHHDAVCGEVCYPETNHTITVVDVSDYNETIHHNTTYKTVVDIPGHWVNNTFTGYCKLTNGEHDFEIVTQNGTQKYRIYHCHEDNCNPQQHGYNLRYLKTGNSPHYSYSLVPDDYYVTTTYKQVVDIPAYDTVIHHDAVTHDEVVVDVPAHCDQFVSIPAYDEIVVDMPGHPEIVVEQEAWIESIVGNNWICDGNIT